jgi:hypothetical protein
MKTGMFEVVHGRLKLGRDSWAEVGDVVELPLTMVEVPAVKLIEAISGDEVLERAKVEAADANPRAPKWVVNEPHASAQPGAVVASGKSLEELEAELAALKGA